MRNWNRRLPELFSWNEHFVHRYSEVLAFLYPIKLLFLVNDMNRTAAVLDTIGTATDIFPDGAEHLHTLSITSQLSAKEGKPQPSMHVVHLFLEVAKSDHRKTNFWPTEVEKMSRHHSWFFWFSELGESQRLHRICSISQMPTFSDGALPCPHTSKSNLEHRLKIRQKYHFKMASKE